MVGTRSWKDVGWFVLGSVLVNKIGLVWHLGEFYWFMSQHTKFLSESLKGKDLSLVSKVILYGNLRIVACWSVSWLFLSRLECNGGLSWITYSLRKNALISWLDEFSGMTRCTELRLMNVDRYWLSSLCAVPYSLHFTWILLISSVHPKSILWYTAGSLMRLNVIFHLLFDGILHFHLHMGLCL